MKALFITPIKEEKRHLFEREGLECIFADNKTYTEEQLQEADIIFGNLSEEKFNSCPNLKWVQLNSAGAEFYKNLRDEIQLTNAAGAYGTAISEHMLGCTLMVMKNLARYQEQQKERSWNNLGSVNTITTSKVLSIGMGNIGSDYARKMALLGAEVCGVRRTVHDKPDYLKELYTLDQLDDILPEFDVVALSLPGTDETKGLFNEERLRRMKKGAILINVGRGSAIDGNALINVMRDHHLAGACLDVTEVEPLPKNNALWTTENVYITPHISGRFNAAVTYDTLIDMFVSNLDKFLAGEPLDHVVNRKLGY